MKKQYKQALAFVVVEGLETDVLLMSGGEENFIGIGEDWGVGE